MPLQIPLSDKEIQITECIMSFFEESKIDGTNFECCNEPNIISLSQITHSPQFIFIYLVRGAYNLSESKNNTFIKFDNYINIPIVGGNILYKLRSVIDHLGGNESGHYFVKTLSGSHWYLINDVQVKKMNPREVPTKNSIGLLIEKVINFDENIPEPLIYYNENCFYQNAFQSILQMLFECCDIQQYFIEYFMKDNKNENVTQNLNFTESLGKLLREMNEEQIQNGVKDLNRIFENSINDNDLNKSYLQILNKINEEIKLPQEHHSESDNETNISVDKNKNNNGFIFDRFYGRISYVTKCGNEVCNKVFKEPCQLFKSLPLIIQSKNQNIPISECIDNYFAISEVEGSELQCCETQKIISISQLTHSPQFLFIYLVRFTNNNTFIEFDNYIDIPTVNGNVLYKLRSVIDRYHENKYLVKMLLKSTWWLKKDCRFQMVNPKNVPSKFSVGLLFEKVTNINHNIPEPLFIDKYGSNYQNALESIVKFLYLCCDIRKHLIDFYTNKDTSDNITANLIFKRKIGEMMVLFDEKETGEIKRLLRETINFLKTKINNIDQLYCCIMDKLNDNINNINTNTKQQSSMPEPDLFGGEISIDLKCKLCEKIFIEGIKTFKSMTIQEPMVTIDECIKNFLEKSQVKLESDYLLQNNESSDKQQIISINQLTNPPQFILIYLVRKCNNFIEFNNYINIPTVNGNVLYKLRYVIDQIVYNHSIYYVVKTLSGSNWLRNNGYETMKINPTDVPTKYTIGLLIEKVTNIDHNVPETLINHNYLCEGALQSIIQMLYQCLDIRKHLIDFYTSDHSNENITDNLIFKRKIGEVMFYLKYGKESGRFENLLKEASNFLPNKSNEIHGLYLCVMNKLNEKGSHSNANLENNDSMDECGSKRSRLQCKNCKMYTGDISKPQFFKSLYLKSENIKLNLSKRIENFCTSQLDAENKMNKCCKNPQIVIVEEILSSPKYLFIYLDRIEGTIENNNDIKLNTQSGERHYFLHFLLKYTTITYTNGQTKGKFSITKYESNFSQKSKKIFESVIAVMLVRKDDNISNSDSESDDKNIDNSIEAQLVEERLESDFIADSIKQIIELNNDNKIYVLLGLLFSCPLFRNIMINFQKNNEIKKLFEKFSLVDIGIFVNSISIIYDRVTGRKEIGPIIQLDNNLSIHQCFNYIFENIKLIMDNKEFNKAIKFNSLGNFNIIRDNFYGTVLLENICNNCSKSHKFEDSFSNLCVKKPQNKSSVNLEKCLIEYGFEAKYQQDEKCCENTEIVLLRKIIHAPKILFICVDEQSRNNNSDCILQCEDIMNIDTLTGPVTYSLVSILDQNDSNMYDVKFLGNSVWWQTYPHSRKITNSKLFTKYNVGFLFKKLE